MATRRRFGGARDSVTDVSYVRNPGYLERVGDSLCGMVFGLLLFSAAFPALWFNEGNAVATEAALLHASANTVGIQPRVADNAALNLRAGDLVHVTGAIRSSGVLHDRTFHVRASGLRLLRRVEMYQWKEKVSETRINEGENTRVEKTYSYSKGWHSGVEDSSRFREPRDHENPSSAPYADKEFEAEGASVGEYEVDSRLWRQVDDKVQLRFSDKYAKVMAKNGLHLDSDRMGVSTSKHESRPRVGDVRVRFFLVGSSGDQAEADEQGYVTNGNEVTVVSLVAGLQVPDKLTRATDKQSGKEVSMIQTGKHSAEKLFENALSANSMQTWLFRFLGWLLMWLGLSMITQIVHTLVDWVPILSTVASVGVSIVNFVISLSLSVIVIALAWVRYRPTLAIAAIAISMVPLFYRGGAKK